MPSSLVSRMCWSCSCAARFYRTARAPCRRSRAGAAGARPARGVARSGNRALERSRGRRSCKSTGANSSVQQHDTSHQTSAGGSDHPPHRRPRRRARRSSAAVLLAGGLLYLWPLFIFPLLLGAVFFFELGSLLVAGWLGGFFVAYFALRQPRRRRPPRARRSSVSPRSAWPASCSAVCSATSTSAPRPARRLVAHRPPDRPLQLRHLRRLPAQRGHQGRPLRRRAHADHARPRPLQALQRPPRARGRQRAAAPRRRHAAGGRARGRHGGPLRRRGVRPADQRRRRRRHRARRARAPRHRGDGARAARRRGGLGHGQRRRGDLHPRARSTRRC